MSIKGQNDGQIIGCGCLLIILFIGMMFTFGKQLVRTDEYITVSSKERVCDGGETTTCYYMVFGTNGEVYENTDSIINWKFDSASVQARIQQGSRYKVTVIGWRIPFLSMKKNIIKAEKVGPFQN